MARRIYSDEDKGRVYAALLVNDGNVTRTSRDTGVAESTIRDWKAEWKDAGPPPEVLKAAEQEVDTLLDDFERVRDKGLRELERMIDAREVKPAQLVATVGMLEDKIRLGKGLATSRSETVHALPPPEEIRDALARYFTQALEAAEQRERDLYEVGDVEIIREELPQTTGG